MADNLATLLGCTILESDAGHGVMETPVTELMLQPDGILHGGISAFFAEHLASECSHGAVADLSKQIAVGLQLDSSHLSSVRAGDTAVTTCEAIRLGKKVQVWKVEQYRKSDGKLFNVSQLTMYVKDLF